MILTLGFDEPSFRHFDAMRRRHFPAKRNKLPAHLTLFHHLNGAQRYAIVDALAASAARTAPIEGRVTGLRFLGYGCAYTIEAPALVRLRASLATRWADDLTAQDAQGFRPHVTIQNKAPAGAAKTLFRELDDQFEPFEIRAESLILWRYLNGPWELEQTFPLQGDPDQETESQYASEAQRLNGDLVGDVGFEPTTR